MWGKNIYIDFGFGIDDKEEFDHGVHLKGPNIIRLLKKLVVYFRSGVLGMLMCDALEVPLVIGL